MSPPDRARLGDGRDIDVAEPARDICRRYGEEFPDERDRYGEAWMPWCHHDNQHVLNWAVEAVSGLTDLEAQLRWLHGVLAARGFPAERVARDVAIAADVMRERGEEAIAERLAAAAASLPR